MLKKLTFIGIIFAIILGTISHNVYPWTGNNFIAGLFSPVNESIWEHMKIAFFPMLIYSFYMNKKLKKYYPCVTSALCFGILLSTALVPVIFYTYSGILGYHTLILDIFTLIAAIIIAFAAIYKLTLSCSLDKYDVLLKTAVIITGVIFFIFTIFPPELSLFISPTE